jgi:acylphosphatase
LKFAEILVTGRVQGVWYRDFVKKNAIALFLSGWVKNNPDGTVSAAVQGEEEIINRLIDKLKIGPPLSKVEDVKVNWLLFENKLNSFKIRR